MPDGLPEGCLDGRDRPAARVRGEVDRDRLLVARPQRYVRSARAAACTARRRGWRCVADSPSLTRTDRHRAGLRSRRAVRDRPPVDCAVPMGPTRRRSHRELVVVRVGVVADHVDGHALPARHLGALRRATGGRLIGVDRSAPRRRRPEPSASVHRVLGDSSCRRTRGRGQRHAVRRDDVTVPLPATSSAPGDSQAGGVAVGILVVAEHVERRRHAGTGDRPDVVGGDRRYRRGPRSAATSRLTPCRRRTSVGSRSVAAVLTGVVDDRAAALGAPDLRSADAPPSVSRVAVGILVVGEHVHRDRHTWCRGRHLRARRAAGW